MEIGEKIQFYRKANNLTLKALADISKVNIRTIQFLESGKRLPKAEHLEKLAKVLPIGGENLLKPDIIIEDVGDVMRIILALQNNIDISFLYDLKEDGTIDCNNIKLQFQSDNINNSISELIQDNQNNVPENQEFSILENMLNKKVSYYDINVSSNKKVLISEIQELLPTISSKYKSKRTIQRFINEYNLYLKNKDLNNLKLITNDKLLKEC